MIKCSKCGKELSEDTNFCDNCGTKVYHTRFCPNCGTQISSEFSICKNCGTVIDSNPGSDSEHVCTDVQNKAVVRKSKNVSKKAISFAVAGVAIVTLLILGVILVSGLFKKSGGKYAMYFKDGEIFYTDFKKNGSPIQLTSKLVDGDVGSYEINRSLFEAKGELGICTYMTEDGKYLFFPDKVDGNEGLNIYYKKVSDIDGDAVKMDSGVGVYTVNSSSSTVTYLKGSEGSLYQYKIADGTKDKIATDVVDFEISEDGNKMIFMTSENSIYIKDRNKDKEKIVSDASSRYFYTSGDLDSVYYFKDGNFYKQTYGGDKTKISSDIYSVRVIYDSEELYYIKQNIKTAPLSDYINDDMRAADESITEPSYPVYPDAPSSPSWWEYDSDDEYREAYEAYEEAYQNWQAECDRMYEEYVAAWNEYTEKNNRDTIRNGISEKTVTITEYSLCFYNGSEEVVVTDSLDYNSYYTCASDAPVAVYKELSKLEFEKPKLSEITGASSAESAVYEAISSRISEPRVAVKSTVSPIRQEKEAGNYTISDDGTSIYYFDNVPDNKNYGDLYHISVSGSKVGEPELYDSDVYHSSLRFTDDGKLIYFKDADDNYNGDLYIDRSCIGYEVRIFSINTYSDPGKIFYYTDWDADKGSGCGTLNVYDGKASVKIADDISDFTVLPDGRVLYLYDYSYSYYSGELYEWNNGESKKIDDEVSGLVGIVSGRYRGDY